MSSVISSANSIFKAKSLFSLIANQVGNIHFTSVLDIEATQSLIVVAKTCSVQVSSFCKIDNLIFSGVCQAFNSSTLHNLKDNPQRESLSIFIYCLI